MKIINPSFEVLKSHVKPEGQSVFDLYKDVEQVYNVINHTPQFVTDRQYEIGNNIYNFNDIIKPEDAPGYPEGREMVTAGFAPFVSWYRFNVEIIPSSSEQLFRRLLYEGKLTSVEHVTVYLRIPQGSDAYMKYAINECSAITISNDKHYCVTTNFKVIAANNWEDDLKYMCEATDEHIKRITVHVTLPMYAASIAMHTISCYAKQHNAGVLLSKASASHCERPLKFVRMIHCGFTDDATDYLQRCEDAYMKMLENGHDSQELSWLLPSAIKTDLVITAQKEDWDALLDRDFGPANYIFQEIANSI